jgi:hypothetical protein
MEKQIIEMLMKMDERFDRLEKRFDRLEKQVEEGFTSVNERLSRIEAKLEGAGYQFESVNESRIDDVAFLLDKVNKLERELYRLKRQ